MEGGRVGILVYGILWGIERLLIAAPRLFLRHGQPGGERGAAARGERIECRRGETECRKREGEEDGGGCGGGDQEEYDRR